jgi:hypothetical protein
VKYLVTVVQGVTVEATSPKEAEAHALALLDAGCADTIGVEVEPLGERTSSDD